MAQIDAISILVGGEAGQGISAAGFLLGKSFLRGGWYAFGDIDYQSLIRGGHNFYTLRAAKYPVYSHWDTVNLVIAMDALTLQRHWKFVSSDGGYIYDSDQIPENSPDLPKDKKFLFGIPLETLLKEINGRPVVRNVITIGATLGILDYGTEYTEDILQETFQRKGDKVVEMNRSAIQAGYNYAKDNFKDDFTYQMTPVKKAKGEKILVQGQDAVVAGAIAAGCKLYVAYPMTPASGVLHSAYIQCL